MEGGKIQQVLKIYAETRHHGEEIESDSISINIIRKAASEEKIYTFDEKTLFCMYKTEYKDRKSIMMLFSFELPKPMIGSSAASDIVMGVVSMIEKVFSPIEYIHYTKDEDGAKIYGFLKIIKFLDN